jgi:hypothetical protein
MVSTDVYEDLENELYVYSDLLLPNGQICRDIKKKGEKENRDDEQNNKIIVGAEKEGREERKSNEKRTKGRQK